MFSIGKYIRSIGVNLFSRSVTIIAMFSTGKYTEHFLWGITVSVFIQQTLEGDWDLRDLDARSHSPGLTVN